MSDERVLAKLRDSLARSRRLGVSFELAWPNARSTALKGLSGDARPKWRHAIDATRSAWESAYDGTPATACESACALLLTSLIEGQQLEPVGAA